MASFIDIVKTFILFKEPADNNEFVLEETPQEKELMEPEYKENASGNVNKKKDKIVINKQICKADIEKSEKDKGNQQEKSKISQKLSENLEYIKEIYSYPNNGDFVIREFNINIKDKVVPAFIIFFDGMIDRKVIDDDILQPLMLLSSLDIKSEETGISAFVRKHLLTHTQIKETDELEQILADVDFGGCGIFIDGMTTAFVADVKGWEHRGIEKPNTEILIRGPQESFSETIRANTALIRKRLKDKNLIVENIFIGEKSQTPCSMMYIKNIANDSLVKEVRRRLKSINVDYLHDSGELEQLIEDSTFVTAPQIIATERPDRASVSLTNGKVVIVVHGSPFVLIMPTTFIELTHTLEDAYLRFPHGSFLRIVRYIGGLLALLLPGIYVAITNYHQEMIPTSLLLSIEASREKVPFPSIVEILIMEISFELIREAGIRIPGPIGPTLGIIGALILGQAAVAASIVSPILIIIVAVTGIGSFAIPNFSAALSVRMLRFVYIILGGIVGFLGISVGLFIHGILLVSAKSFGVPFLAPIGPKTAESINNYILRKPVWKQEDRPDYLNAKDTKKQPKISRGWIKGKAKDGDSNGK